MTGIGKKWQYQQASSLGHILRDGLDVLYKTWFEDMRQKEITPLFLVSGGQGIGKSRLLDEFHKESLRCLSDPTDKKLKDRIEEAYVFKVILVVVEMLIPAGHL